MAFSDKLRQLRKENQLTQAALSEALKINVRTVKHYEAGTIDPSITALAKIADFFKVNTDFLLDRTNDPAPPLPANAMIGTADIQQSDGN